MDMTHLGQIVPDMGPKDIIWVFSNFLIQKVQLVIQKKSDYLWGELITLIVSLYIVFESAPNLWVCCVAFEKTCSLMRLEGTDLGACVNVDTLPSGFMEQWLEDGMSPFFGVFLSGYFEVLGEAVIFP